MGSPILNPLSDTEKALTNFVCDFFKLTATLMPKQSQRIDIILPFYPFELKLYFSSPRPTYFWERRQSQDCNAEKRMGNATGQILHLINMLGLCLVKRKLLGGYFAAVAVTPRSVSVCEIVCRIVFARFFLKSCSDTQMGSISTIKQRL